MNRWKSTAAESAGRRTRICGAYLSAVLAMGWGFGARPVGAQNQAINPVNVAGESGGAAPALVPGAAAASPSAANPAAAAPGRANGIVPTQAPAAGLAQAAPTQGVVPVDVGGAGNGTPAAATPGAAPGGSGAGTTVQAPPAPRAPATPPAPAAPAPVPTAGTPAAPTAPGSPAAPATPATPTAPAVAQAPAAAAEVTTQPTADDGKVYPLTGLKIDYKAAHPEQPPIDELLNTEVRLGILGDAYVAPRSGVPTVTVKLGDVGKNGPQKIYRSGIAAIYGSIVRFYNAKGIIGVFVVVDANDIDANDNDTRPAGRTTLQLVVVTSTVKQVRTVAIGDTSNEAERVDNPRHKSIREHSPLQPAPGAMAAATTEPTTAPAAPEGGTPTVASGPRSDLLKKDVLDDYVLRLNRYPGRRVDVAVSGTNDPGGVTLDYLVSETRPWYVYAQASNTGTKQTSDWRERFGFVDNQLTGHDDILTVDYTTAGFSSSQALLATYELPFLNLDRVRYKAYGSWNEYTASDVGQNNEQFTGKSWTGGNEWIWNVFQHRELFVDAVGGFRFQGLETNNVTSEVHGQANYFEPYLGLKLERGTDIATTTGSATLIGFVTKADEKDLSGLGRAEPTRDPVVLQFDFAHSFYLEPFIDPQRFAMGSSTLANEIYVSMRGQYAFNDRLVPQFEDVAGGLYTVRGYPESIVAGDSVIIGSAEYRFHVPRVFAVQADPTKTPFLWDKSFRMSPQQPYGRPDWDLLLRAFVDAAEVVNSNRQSFEKDASLVGTGVGMEIQYKQNFNLRIDWGVALTDIPEQVKAGSNRFHISTTFLY